MDALHVEIDGTVQGVGFRWFAREEGRKLRLAGWVRNRPDGRVEVAAAGSAEALQRFRERLTKGPPGARVEEVRELDPVAPDSLQPPFTILR